MRIYFENADDLLTAINCIKDDLHFEMWYENKGQDLTVRAEKNEGDCLEVSLNGDFATITYGKSKVSFFRGLMLVCEAIFNGKKEFYAKETPYFEVKGLLLDVSRNAALNIRGIKYFIRQSAIAGLNSLHLYLEDMFEIEDHPYFGYMRGRYTKAEIKDICSYADSFGIEIIPHIELFGHLGKYLHYQHTAPYRTNERTLLVGEPKAYEFIDKILKAISESFLSKTLYIGFDEVIGANQGTYRARNGERPLEDVFFEHANKVYEAVKKYGFKPFMDNDMYFYFRSERMPDSNYACHADVDFEEELTKKVPEGMCKNFWNYQQEDEDKMTKMMELSKQLGGEVSWSGGVRMWQSLCAQYTPTITNAIVGTNSCKRTGIKRVTFTAFEDSGEVPHFVAIPAMFIIAQLDYNGTYDENDIKSKIKFIYGLDYSDFLLMEQADLVHQQGGFELATKFLMYNDPLIGLLDKDIEGLDLRKYYGDLVKEYKNRGICKGPLGLSFNQYKKMLDILELKADYGVRLKAAYDADDKKVLKALADEALIIKNRYEEMLCCLRELYANYYRGCGFERVETRYGTMSARFATARYRILAYLNGELESIDELEQEKLKYNHNRFECPNDENLFFGTGFINILSEA